MSENLDLVRSIFAAWERGDFSRADWAHPEIEYSMADGPQPGRWSGLASMTEGPRELLSVWDGYRVEADEYREIDGERVLVLLHASGRGKTSGVELAETAGPGTGANIFHVRDGKVTRLVAYFDSRNALADLGLATKDE
jgi:ketosteroid isomerase-like protein